MEFVRDESLLIERTEPSMIANHGKRLAGRLVNLNFWIIGINVVSTRFLRKTRVIYKKKSQT